MNKSKLLKTIVAIVSVVAISVGGYTYRDAIHSRIARTAAVVSGQEIKPLLDSEGRYIRQIVAKDNSTSRTIMWQSDSSEADAVIEFRVDGSENIQTLTGLTPSTKYEYRVGYGNDRRSDWYSLETAGASVYDVLIYPDSQSGDYSGWEQLVKDSAHRNPRTAL